VYQYVVDCLPRRDRSIYSQRGVILCSLALGDQPAAAAGTDKLLADYTDSQHMPGIVRSIAVEYRHNGKPEQALPLHQYVVDKYPTSREAIRCLRDYVCCAADLRDGSSIEAGIQRLFRDFSTSGELPRVACHIGDRLSSDNHPRAYELFEYVVDRHPRHELAITAKIYMGNIRLCQGDDEQAEAIYRETLNAYPGNPRLPEATNLVALGYYQRARREQGSGRPIYRDYYQKAMEVWENVLRDFPQSTAAAQACYHSAVVYGQELGDKEQALQCFRRVAEGRKKHLASILQGATIISSCVFHRYVAEIVYWLVD